MINAVSVRQTYSEVRFEREQAYRNLRHALSMHREQLPLFFTRAQTRRMVLDAVREVREVCARHHAAWLAYVDAFAAASIEASIASVGRAA